MIVGDQTLATRLERFQAEINGDVGNSVAGDAILRIAGGVAIFAGADSLLTQAFAVGMGEPAGEAELDAIEEFYRVRGAPTQIHVTPWTDPALVAAMTARGYVVHEFENVFARTLRPEDERIGSEIRVEIVTPETAQTWTRVGAHGFATEGLDPDWLAGILAPYVAVPSVRCYLAYVDGQPAGTGAAAFHEETGVAGLFGAATLPEFRGRGVQAALVERRLSDAVKAGCELATVTTAPGSASHRNVVRRGFELAYTKLSMLFRSVP